MERKELKDGEPSKQEGWWGMKIQWTPRLWGAVVDRMRVSKGWFLTTRILKDCKGNVALENDSEMRYLKATGRDIEAAIKRGGK